MPSFVGLFVRKPNMSRQDYVERYENRHAPFALSLTPFMSDYRRNHFRSENMIALDHLPGGAAGLPYDTAIELDFESEHQLAELNRVLMETEAGKLLAADEEEQFDRGRMILFHTDRNETPHDQLAPRPATMTGEPPVKLLAFFAKRTGMSRADFIDHYETRHAPLAVSLVRSEGRPIIARYRRAFPVEGSPMALPHLPKGTALDFDAMTSFAFWSEADLQAFERVCADPEIAAVLAEDEARFIARETVRIARVDEYITPYDSIARQHAALSA